MSLAEEKPKLMGKPSARSQADLHEAPQDGAGKSEAGLSSTPF